MDTERNKALDVARGLGIILVSIYHLVYRPKDGVADNLIREAIWLEIPFFLFISGFYYKAGQRKVGEYISHKVETLLIPTLKYTATLLILGGVYCAFVHDYTWQNFFRDVIFTYLRPEFSSLIIPEWGYGGILFENISAVWFVWTMMFASSLFYKLEGIFGKATKSRIAVSIILILISMAVYPVRKYFSWNLTGVPAFVAIMVLSSYFVIKVNYFYAFLAVIAHVILFQLCGTDKIVYNDLGTIGAWSVPAFCLQTFIGTYALIVFSTWLQKNFKLAVILEFIGKNSLIFLLFHCAFAVIFNDLFHTYIKPGPFWYMEDINQTVTPEIFMKSLTVWSLSLMSCALVVNVQSKIGGVIRKNEAKK